MTNGPSPKVTKKSHMTASISPICPLPNPLHRSSPTNPIPPFPPLSHILFSITTMKRPISSLISSSSSPNTKVKQIKLDDDDEDESITAVGFMNLDEDLLYEILKHADARTVAVAACVSKLWHRTAQDERIWELICTRHSTNIGCGTQQLRSVVLALGGFKQLHSQYLWPLSKSSSCGACGAGGASTSGAVQPRLATAFSMMPPPVAGRRWGKDEVHLSLSLLSIKCFEKMNFDGGGKSSSS